MLSAASVSAAVTLQISEPNIVSRQSLRRQFSQGEYLHLEANATAVPQGGRIKIEARPLDSPSQSRPLVLWQGKHDRPVHVIRIATSPLPLGQYEVRAIAASFDNGEAGTQDAAESSLPLKIGINAPVADRFPIFSFSLDKYNVTKTMDGYRELIQRYKAGGYNQIYFFASSDAVTRNGLESPRGNVAMNELLNECTQQGMGLVPMFNTFLYGPLEDETSSVAASGNFPSTYVYFSTYRRMQSVRHPRHVEGVLDRMREYLVYAKQWPVIRGLSLDDEPTASFYNVNGMGRVDKAPEGEQFWGLGDYNKVNQEIFRQRYGHAPPRYATAGEVHKRYPPGSVIPRKDPWIQWMEFTGSTFGDYYEQIVPKIREMMPEVPIFSQPFLGLAGGFWGTESQSFHHNLDRINFHYIAEGQPAEGAASSMVMAQSFRPVKPILAMIHTANFNGRRPDATLREQIYSPAYVMQQFWSCIGLGAKGIGDQGEFDISQRPDTWQHWTRAAHDVTAISPLLLKADRPRSPVALLYSTETEWIHAAYRKHPLEIWRGQHTHELIQAALQRANVPFDIVSTSQLAKNPKLLNGYKAVICAAMDYVVDDVNVALNSARTTFYVTPESAWKPRGARVMKHNFNELYRLYLEAGLRDPRTHHNLVDQRAAYLRDLLHRVPLQANASSSDTLLFTLNAPGSLLVTPVNCGPNWESKENPTEETMKKVRHILGEDFVLPQAQMEAGTIQAKVDVKQGRFAYDLREHKEIAVSHSKTGLSFTRTLSGGEGTVVAVTPTKIERLQIASVLKKADNLSFQVRAFDQKGARLSWALPIKVELLDPSGQVSNAPSNILLENGVCEVSLPLISENANGAWRIRVTELASSIQATAIV